MVLFMLCVASDNCGELMYVGSHDHIIHYFYVIRTVYFAGSVFYWFERLL